MDEMLQDKTECPSCENIAYTELYLSFERTIYCMVCGYRYSDYSPDEEPPNYEPYKIIQRENECRDWCVIEINNPYGAYQIKSGGITIEWGTLYSPSHLKRLEKSVRENKEQDTLIISRVINGDQVTQEIDCALL